MAKAGNESGFAIDGMNQSMTTGIGQISNRTFSKQNGRESQMFWS